MALLRAHLVQLSAAEPNKVFVALWLPRDVASGVAVVGGEPASELHVTLVYAKARNVNAAQVADVVRGVVAQHAPLRGSLGGIGRFPASKSSEGREVMIRLVDVPGLSGLRQAIVRALGSIGIKPNPEHGYTPHCTLAYVEPGAELLDPRPLTDTPLRFGEVVLKVDDVTMRLPLAGERVELTDTETKLGPWRDPRPLEQRLDMAAKRRHFDDAARQLATALGDGADAAWVDLAEQVDRIVRGGLHPNDVARVAVSEPVAARIRADVARVLRQAHRVGQADAARDVTAQVKPGRLSARAGARLIALSGNREWVRMRAGAPLVEVVTFAAGDGLIGAEAERYFEAKSFYVTGVLLDDMVARAKAVLFNSLRAPKPISTILADLSEQLAPFIPDRDAAGRAVNVPHRLETIARTNTAEAVNEGRWATFQDADLEGVVEAFEYSAILDDRVRPNHRAWDGVQEPAEFWLGPPDRRPPNGFQCRCTLLPVILDAQPTPEDALPSEEVVDPGFK